MNLGAFEDFSKLCVEGGLDLLPTASDVCLYDIPMIGERGAAVLEPWLHRIRDFDTFLDRLTRAFEIDRAEVGVVNRARIIHHVILCLPGSVLGAADDEAMRVKQSVRKLLDETNRAESGEFSVVLFAAGMGEGRCKSLAKGLAALLRRKDRVENIHLPRNGFVANLTQDTEKKRFSALRLLIEVIRDEEIWTRKLRSSSGPAVMDESSMVRVFRAPELPDWTNGTVIAWTLSGLLAGRAGASTAAVAEDDPDMKRLRELKGAIAQLPEVVPSGMQDPFPAGQGRGKEGLAQPPALEPSRSADGGEATGSQGKLRFVKAPGQMSMVQAQRFLDGLARWYDAALAELDIHAGSRFEKIRESFNAIDKMLAQFEAGPIRNVPEIVKGFRDLRETVSEARKRSEADAKGFAAKRDKLRDRGFSGVKDLKSWSEFEKEIEALRKREENVIGWKPFLAVVGFVYGLIVVAYVVGATKGLWPYGSTLLNAFVDPTVTDHMFWYEYWWLLTLLLSFTLFLAVAGSLASWISLHRAYRKIGKKAQELGKGAMDLFRFEYSARLHAYVASRLSIAEKKLAWCLPDPGDERYALTLAGAAPQGAGEPGAAYKALREAVETVFNDIKEDNTSKRIRQTLEAPVIRNSVQTGALTVEVKGFQGHDTGSQRWAASAVRIEFAEEVKLN